MSSQSDLQQIKHRTKEGFKKLKEVGIYAKGKHLDCSGCAGADLRKKARALNDGFNKRYLGIAYWHEQDEENFDVTRTLYIGFDTINAEIEAEAIGILIKQELERQGLRVQWQGNSSKRVEVLGIVQK